MVSGLQWTETVKVSSLEGATRNLSAISTKSNARESTACTLEPWNDVLKTTLSLPSSRLLHSGCSDLFPVLAQTRPCYSLGFVSPVSVTYSDVVAVALYPLR